MICELQLFTENECLFSDVVTDLKQCGCCNRCILRFLGEKSPDVYRHSQQEIQKKYFGHVKYDQENINADSSQQCPACLGILQTFCSLDLCKEIQQKLDKSDYEISNYQFSLIVPVSILVRQHAIYVFLLQKYISVYEGRLDAIASIKDVFKWSLVPCFSSYVGLPFLPKSDFEILLTVNYSKSDQDCACLLELFRNTFRKRKGFTEVLSRASVQSVLSEVSPESFAKCVLCPPAIPSTECTCDVSFSHHPVFIAGRYNKFSRSLSQTPWIMDGKTKVEGSVQECICPVILSRFKATDYKFSAAGREDVDVKMLGKGRPFVVELIQPHRVKFSAGDIESMQLETNKSTSAVCVTDLQVVSREEVVVMRDGAESKSKSYTVLCWCERHLTSEDIDRVGSMKDLVICQNTPLRVLHRRSLAVRERKIYNMRVEPTEGLQFMLHISTQAGTYIKEFVHGDFGRTQPNLSTLLKADCDIITLDVNSVDLDWPPSTIST